jgi:23S rRNA pseudouridine2605 synthase
MQERLQKIISRAGIASRRHAEQLILSGSVTVNGKIVTELGTKADAAQDHIKVGSQAVRVREGEKEYYAFYKPPRVVSTMNDPEHRPCLEPYLRSVPGRIFPVGRLEFGASGLLLLTSDGELASRLMRAAANLSQTWRIKMKGRILDETRQTIEREARVRMVLSRDAPNPWYEVEMRDARRDLLRQAFARRGLLVEKMIRVRLGGVEMGPLEAGQSRNLTQEEVAALERASGGINTPVPVRRTTPIRQRRRRGSKSPEERRAGPAVQGTFLHGRAGRGPRAKNRREDARKNVRRQERPRE